jgi:hypothetical protein
VKAWLAVTLAATCAPGASAQVGSRPERSPYRDLEYTQEWTWFAGYYNAKEDPERVAPQSGTMFGARWDLRLGGPAYLTTRMAGAALNRRIIDPTQPIEERFVGEETVPLLFTDVGFSFSLTGFKTWRHLVPNIATGVGTTADLRGRTDVAKFRFGAPFTFTYGAGVKWVPGGKWQVRADWSNYLLRIHYPQSYYLRTGSDDPVRLPNEPRSLWRRNVAYQVGLSYLFHR